MKIMWKAIFLQNDRKLPEMEVFGSNIKKLREIYKLLQYLNFCLHLIMNNAHGEFFKLNGKICKKKYQNNFSINFFWKIKICKKW